MRLIACAPPGSDLVDAPVSPLCEQEAAGAWKGYWSVESAAYFARLVDATGAERWYAMTDTPRDEAKLEVRDVLSPPRREAGRGASAIRLASNGALRMRRMPQTQKTILTGTVQGKRRKTS